MAQIRTVQALRALAATSVAFGHLLTEAGQASSAAPSASAQLILDWSGVGVDLFFVISGFIMVYAAQDLAATTGGALSFLRRRIARIVPLYWLMTTLFLLTLLLAPKSVNSALPTYLETLKSYVFIPYVHAGSDEVRPIFKLGWTLDYEMFFYIAFAVFLLLPARFFVSSLTIFFVALVGLGAALVPTPGAFAFWSDPIILEFVFGVWIGALFVQGERLSTGRMLALTAAALAFFVISNRSGDSAAGLMRLAVRGVPSALLVAAVALWVKSTAKGGRLMAALVMLGDASYALYLSHPWVMRPMHLVWDHIAVLRGGSAALFVGLGLVLCFGLAILIHRLFERPATRWMQRMLTPASPKSAPVLRVGLS